ncbi:hypothetical protein [Pseudomonas aeruginosa]|uniref:hypothetical protein n=1 Tax=Pseudomonas aeruginosa TaxID=287 RepID=UPI001F51B66F|nr:hypothetical protein [Pseudomonas aeruginosa]MCI0909609.1 hypothetical protein [Pseudomonas aeruginosa]
MSIDWSKAPEGATHWEPRSYDFAEGWMRKDGDGWSYWSEGREVWVRGVLTCDVSPEREATFEARPQEAWDGQGLPPVGVECEYRHMIWPEYRRCEIRYISDESLVAYDNGQEQHYRTHDMLFRPLRTPSRSLAEEREKAIEEMCFAEETLTVKQAKALYDAGYRRQESST